MEIQLYLLKNAKMNPEADMVSIMPILQTVDHIGVSSIDVSTTT